MKRSLAKALFTSVASVGLLAVAPMARADDKPPAPPPAWTDTLKVTGYVQGGITFNPDDPASHINFGRLDTSPANVPVLNQASLTLTRPTDPNATGYDFGFNLTGTYGTDERFAHFLGEFDHTFGGPYQFVFTEADVLAHLPWFTSGGVDAKIGQFPNAFSAEAATPLPNALYSHSYIFNFGIPVSHTGGWTITHVDPMVDLWLGLDTGNQTTFGPVGDQGGGTSGMGGFNFNLLDGNITILALTHIGDVNGAMRYYNDITTTIKWNDDLSFTTDLNYIRDDGLHAQGGGVAQYVSYALNDYLILQTRAEVWDDPQGQFVAGFPGANDPFKAQIGDPHNSIIAGPKTAYAAFTLGVNIKPPVPATFQGTVIRPEIRYDQTLNGAHAFNDGKSDHQFTLGTDVIIPF